MAPFLLEVRTMPMKEVTNRTHSPYGIPLARGGHKTLAAKATDTINVSQEFLDTLNDAFFKVVDPQPAQEPKAETKKAETKAEPKAETKADEKKADEKK